jgi:hypothetical protein
MSRRRGDFDQSSPAQDGVGRDGDGPAQDQPSPPRIGSADGRHGQSQQRDGSAGQHEHGGGTLSPGQQGGSSALDQELNRDDDGKANGDELGENR